MSSRNSGWTSAPAALLLAFLGACAPNDSPSNETLDPRGLWHTNDPDSTLTIDHSAWDEFLKTYVTVNPDGVNRVDYESVSQEHKDKLDQYIKYLGSIEISKYNRDEQIAFWMNLYSAGIVKIVLESWPVDSILQIRGPGINVVGPWLQPVARIEGKRVSFNDIEHNILRPAFNDMGPKIHYGINCASITCPSLMPSAHTAANWRENLEANARQYLRSGEAAREENGGLFVSKIYFSWFQDDFGGTDAAVFQHLKQYASPELAEMLDGHEAIAGDFYDWRVNKPDAAMSRAGRRSEIE